MKKLLVLLAALLLPVEAHAQSTKAAMITEVNTNLATGQTGGITALQLRTTMTDLINSIMPTAPVTSNAAASYSGTTGLLQDSKVVLTVPASAATLTLASGTTLTSTTSTSVGAGQYLGEPSNGAATAGNIGEYIESILASGSATSLTTGTAKTITSVSLTAGDWDVSGTVYFTTAATTSVTKTSASLSLTTNTDDVTAGRLNISTFAAVVPTALTGLSTPIGPYRFSLSGTTSIFLVANQTFTASTLTGWGIIRARRVR